MSRQILALKTCRISMDCNKREDRTCSNSGITRIEVETLGSVRFGKAENFGLSECEEHGGGK